MSASLVYLLLWQIQHAAGARRRPDEQREPPHRPGADEPTDHAVLQVIAINEWLQALRDTANTERTVMVSTNASSCRIPPRATRVGQATEHRQQRADQVHAVTAAGVQFRGMRH